MGDTLNELTAYYFGVSDEAISRFSDNRGRLFICHQVNYLEIDLEYPLYEFLY